MDCPQKRTMACVLAAGGSARMGRPKLLIPWRTEDGGTACLLGRACAAACASRAAAVAVVCGAHADALRAVASQVGTRPIAVLENPAWELGQATSVARAARAAREGGYDALVVMVADQPFVEARHLDALIAAYSGLDDSACARPLALRATRSGRGGNPCLFNRAAFTLLEGLAGDEGARRLIAAGTLDALPVPFDDPVDEPLFFDIDTPADFAAFERIRARRAGAAVGSEASDAAPSRPDGSGRVSDGPASAADAAGRLDPAAVRADFPVLGRAVGAQGETLCYLDSAATALVPEQVRRRVDAYLTTSCGPVHRGAHLLAEESTDAYESAREHVARFIGAADAAQVILTHGATESLNLVAQCWAAARLAPGDTVVLTEDAHHAAIVPFQMLAERTGVALRFVRVGADGLLDAASWEAARAERPRLVVLTHTGNVLGFTQPLLSRIMAEAQADGALVALDAAQAVGHVPFSVDEGRFDFAAFSAHKLHGLGGIGALWCSRRALDGMRPSLGGGGMIERVGLDGYAAAPGPGAFEPGTPAVAAAVAFDAALSYLETLGTDAVARHTEALCRRAVSGLGALPGVRVLGPLDAPRSALVTFALARVHPHDASERLSTHGIMVRAGHHCAMPLHRALGVGASVRASFAAHTTEADVDRLVAAVRAIVGEE